MPQRRRSPGRRAQARSAKMLSGGRPSQIGKKLLAPQLRACGRWAEVATPAGDIPALPPPGAVEAFTPRMDAMPVRGQHAARSSANPAGTRRRSAACVRRERSEPCRFSCWTEPGLDTRRPDDGAAVGQVHVLLEIPAQVVVVGVAQQGSERPFDADLPTVAVGERDAPAVGRRRGKQEAEFLRGVRSLHGEDRSLKRQRWREAAGFAARRRAAAG